MGDIIEIIFGLGALVVGIYIYVNFFRGLGAGGRAIADVVKGKSTFVESFKANYVGMEEFTTRIIEKTVGEEEVKFPVYVVEAKGMFPQRTIGKKVSFITHIFDETQKDKPLPVLSLYEHTREEETMVFEDRREFGEMRENYGFMNWAEVSVILKDSIRPPYKGRRKLTLQTCIISTDNPPKFKNGFTRGDNKASVYAVYSNTQEIVYGETGYLEAKDERIKVEKFMIQLAMYVAAIDGNLDQTEGNVIKDWAKRIIEGSGEGTTKARLNKEISIAFNDASNNKLSLSKICDGLNESAIKEEKYEALELAFKVLSSDQVADTSELETLKKAAEALKVDMKEFNEIRDREIAKVTNIELGEQSKEALIGIDPKMSKDEIIKHLQKEYVKWNSRANSKDEQIKKRAREMLLLIAKIREKHVN